jgi:hypothetical protein
VIAMLVIALLTAGAVAACFVVLVAGIQVSERRMGLAGPPRCRADAFARWVLRAEIGHREISPRRTARPTGQRRESDPLSPVPPHRPGSGRGARSGEPS